MKNDLTCAVVRDLLPAYTEGLTEEETNQAVERHLDACPQCRGRCDAMRLDAALPSPAEEREVDYLKTVNRRGKRRTLRAVAATALIAALLIGGAALKLFVIGEPASAAGMSWTLQEDGGAVNLRAFSTWSGIAYCRWETKQEGDTVYIRANKVLPSWLYPTADYRTRIPLDGVESVYLAEQLIWQDGEAIFASTMDLAALQTPYTGDAPALGAIAEALGLHGLGDFTNSLRTGHEPYGWTVDFTTGDPDTIHDAMTLNALYMLALVDNLGEVAWTAPDGSSRTWTTEDAGRHLRRLVEEYNTVYDRAMEVPSSIKDWSTPAGLARLEKLTVYVRDYKR